MYTAIVLTPKDQARLKERVKMLGFNDWEVKCHHCTLHMGHPTREELDLYNDLCLLKINKIGISDKAVAFRVDEIKHPRGVEVKSQNAIPHITLLVNTKDGAKSKDSNTIQNWMEIETPIFLTGYICIDA